MGNQVLKGWIHVLMWEVPLRSSRYITFNSTEASESKKRCGRKMVGRQLVFGCCDESDTQELAGMKIN